MSWLLKSPTTRLLVQQLFLVNTLRSKQDGRHLSDDIFKCIFSNENIIISIKISLKFSPKGPINNIPALVQIMDWRRPATSHYLNQWWLDYRRIYASLGLNELTADKQNPSSALEGDSTEVPLMRKKSLAWRHHILIFLTWFTAINREKSVKHITQSTGAKIQVPSSGSIHQAVRRLTAKSREVLKPRDCVL